MERVFAVEGPDGLRPPPQPFAGVFPRTLGDFGATVARLCAWTPPLTADEFVGLYTGARARRYAAAVEGLATKPFSAKDAYLSSFVKGESVLLTPDKPDPAPRLIQPRSARYNVLVGRYLRPLEHALYDAITDAWEECGMGDGSQIVFKGVNARQSAQLLRRKWRRFADPEGRGVDATRFDQHVSAQALAWEHGVYVSCFRGADARELQSLLRHQLINTGFVRCNDGGFRYRVRGGRMSGDMNTALGNCLISCALVYRFAREHNICIELANNGDDCQLIYERKHSRIVDKFGVWCLKYGFQMKMEQPVHHFEQIEFCQTNPVQIGDDEWVMCRDPRKALAKDCIYKHASPSTSEREYRAWLRSVGMCGTALCDGVPVMAEFYRMLCRHGLNGTHNASAEFADSGFARMSRGLRSQDRPITPEARYSFWLAFGILPEMQEALERHFRGLQVDLRRRVGQTLTTAFSFINFI